MDNFEQSERSCVIALREPNGCLVGYWNGARKYFSTLLPSQYTLRGAKSVCTKTVYPMLSDSPLERYRTISIESSRLHAEECQNRRSLELRADPLSIAINCT